MTYQCTHKGYEPNCKFCNPTVENRNTRIRALVNRGLRGGLTAGYHLGSDEVHHLCELLDAHFKEEDRILIRLREVLEEAKDIGIDTEGDALVEAHALCITLMGEESD